MDTISRSEGDSTLPAVDYSRDDLDIAKLTRLLVKGDGHAFQTFHGVYFDRLYRYLLVVTAGDEHLSREAIQGTFVRVIKYVKVFSEEEIFWSWLTVLARSALSDTRRKQTRYRTLLERFGRLGEVESTAQDIGRTDDRLATLLDGKLQALPADERRLIEQKYFQQLPIRSIAAQALVSEKAVESLLGRIRQKLKKAVLSELRNESSH